MRATLHPKEIASFPLLCLNPGFDLVMYRTLIDVIDSHGD